MKNGTEENKRRGETRNDAAEAESWRVDTRKELNLRRVQRRRVSGGENEQSWTEQDRRDGLKPGDKNEK